MTLDLSTVELGRGEHTHRGEGTSILEAVSLYSGRAFSDTPGCVSPTIAAFVRRWADDLDDATRQDLRGLIPLLAQTSVSGEVDGEVEAELAGMALNWLVKEAAAAWLRAAGMTDVAATLARRVEARVLRAAHQTVVERLAAFDDGQMAAIGVRDLADGKIAFAGCGAATAAAQMADEGRGDEALGSLASALVRDAARLAAYQAARGRDTAPQARMAARCAIRDTARDLHESAFELVHQMIRHAKTA